MADQTNTGRPYLRSAFLQRRINLKLIYAENGVAYLRSELITSPHGFATRIGGVSALPHTKGLNLAFGRGDEKETVLENLSLFETQRWIPYHHGSM